MPKTKTRITPRRRRYLRRSQRRRKRRAAAVATTIFKRLEKARSPVEKTIQRPENIQHGQRLLEWLLRWPNPTVRGKDIRIYGPRPRDRKSMLDSADVLVRHGWLSPVQSRRYDGHIWQIIRKPIIPPKVSQVAD